MGTEREHGGSGRAPGRLSSTADGVCMGKRWRGRTQGAEAGLPQPPRAGPERRTRPATAGAWTGILRLRAAAARCQPPSPGHWMRPQAMRCPTSVVSPARAWRVPEHGGCRPRTRTAPGPHQRSLRAVPGVPLACAPRHCSLPELITNLTTASGPERKMSRIRRTPNWMLNLSGLVGCLLVTEAQHEAKCLWS